MTTQIKLRFIGLFTTAFVVCIAACLLTMSFTVVQDASAAAPPPSIGLPFAAGEKALLLQGPHTNNADVCSYPSSGAPCNALDLVPTSGVVRAAGAGTVHIFSYCQPGLVAIDHGDGWWTGYYHLTNVAVTNGEPVSQGQAIGDVGNGLPCGGFSSTAHVHFFVKYVPPGQSIGDIFRNTSVDVDLQGLTIAGWQISGRQWSACMTYQSTGERKCAGQDITNYGGDGRIIHTSAALIPHDGASGYVLDGYGGLHQFGNAPAVASPSTWPGWDIARSIAVVAPGKGYILDGYGGLHSFGGAPALADPAYWSGWDIARGIALCPGGGGGYVLDGWGGVHPIGNAQALAGGPYWEGWDIARGIVVNSSCAGGYVLDGYGGVHSFGNAPAVNTTAYWGGWDIARSITLVTDTSGYVLDGYGAVHPFAASGVPMPPAPGGAGYQGGSDVYRSLVIDPLGETGVQVSAYQAQADGSVAAGQINVISEPQIHTSAALIPHDGVSGYVLDGYGGLHNFGNAPTVASPSTWTNWDIARGIAVVAPGKGYILDGYGGLHPFGGASSLADPAYWSGWDIARGIALCPGGGGGYVLDGYGGIHPIGNAHELSGSPYWSGWDIARGIVVNSSCTGGYVLDGYGGVHSFGNAPAVNTTAYWGGWDIASSITLVTGSSGYVLDGYGAVHPFAASGVPVPPAISNPLYDAAQTDPFDAFVYSPGLKTGFAVTRSNSSGLFWTSEIH